MTPFDDDSRTAVDQLTVVQSRQETPRKDVHLNALLKICCLLTLVTLPGCYAPRKNPASATRGRAFIYYWPPPKGNTQPTLAVKDLIDMKGVVTTAGSEYIAKTRPPAVRDAKCLAGARAKNVYIVGKTNLSEFALTVSGVNQYFGTPKNLRSFVRRIIPGGSSSGSGVAVEFSRADIAFGTDTAGSVRIPAACCGVYGLKTTYGLVPLDGVFPLSPKHLDTVGPMAKDLPRLVQGMDLLQDGFTNRYESQVRKKPSGTSIKVGRLYLDGTNPLVDQAVDAALSCAQFRLLKLDDEFRRKWLKAQRAGLTVALADAWLNDRKYLNKRGVNIVTRAVIALGKIEYELNYKAALRYRMEWRRALEEVFQEVDFIAVPTLQDRSPSVPFFGGSSPLFELRVFGIQNTASVNLAGNPALAIPIPVDLNPTHVTSLQLVGPPLSEAALVNAARIVKLHSEPPMSPVVQWIRELAEHGMKTRGLAETWPIVSLAPWRRRAEGHEHCAADGCDDQGYAHRGGPSWRGDPDGNQRANRRGGEQDRAEGRKLGEEVSAREQRHDNQRKYR